MDGETGGWRMALETYQRDEPSGGEGLFPSRGQWVPPTSLSLERRLAGYRKNAGCRLGSDRSAWLAAPMTGPDSGSHTEQVRLSPLGQKIGRWYGDLRAIQDQADREAALAGVGYLKQRLTAPAADPLSSALARLIDDCCRGSERLQQSTFAVIGKLAQLELPLETWVRLYLLRMATDLLPVMVEESLDLLHDESPGKAIQETFEFFLHLWENRGYPNELAEAAEKRRYHRKKIHLPGQFEPVHSNARSEIIIQDICPGGIGFRAIGREIPQEHDLIRVFFLLEGYLGKCIDKMALVRRFDGVYAGVQFL